jgi:hypothetical protein
MEYLTATMSYLPEELQDDVCRETWQLWERIWSQLSDQQRSAIVRSVQSDRALEREQAKRMLPAYLAMHGII